MLDIFQFDFMFRALIAGIAIGIVAPTVGIFLVVRRYSHLADTLAHVSLAGLAISSINQFSPLAASFGITVAAAIGIERLRQTKTIYGESVLSLFLSGSLALATILFSFSKGFNAGLMNFLFGSIATVTWNEMYATLGLGAATVILIGILYKSLFLVSFDDELARVKGLNPSIINLILMMVAALTVTLAMRVVGVLLIGSLMIIPVITALQFRTGFKKTLFLSILFSFLAVVSGIFGSYYLDLASGGAIVSVSVIMFLGSLLFSRFIRELKIQAPD